jgi:formamidopyrimidine-DNA glycosylase
MTGPDTGYLAAMPELPDVEGFRAVLAGHATGRPVRRVEVADAGVLRGVSARRLDEALRGHRFTETTRHGKWLIAGTDGPVLLLHFGMTGSLHWSADGEPRHRHDRVVFVLGKREGGTRGKAGDSGRGGGGRADGQGGELRYRDMRKLKGLTLAADRDQAGRVLAGLGPDALEISAADLACLLAGRRAAVKAVLVDQHAIAGLGNLLADEILWRALIFPRRRASDLTGDERRRLHREMRAVLRAAVRAGRVPPRPSWLTGVRDHSEAACPRCGTRLERARIGGRATVWCPRDQPGPGTRAA